MICRGVRSGTVLRKKTILKSDHFPSSQNPSLFERIEGAPNFRQADDMDVFGVGQPTVGALSQVVRRVGAASVCWCNLREEPCVYINNRPYCLKARESPFNNLENTGLEAADVERMEEVLKREIIEEAASLGGEILLHDETSPAAGGGVAAWGEVYAYWESVNPQNVQTPREVFQRLKAAGYNVNYHRVPITDECSPEEKIFDQIAEILTHVQPREACVFNCQLGRGRTTTGMVIACILWRRIKGLNAAPEWDMSRIKLWSPQSHGDLQWGEYRAVGTMMSALGSRFSKVGHRKSFVDATINKCSHMQNIRLAILEKKIRSDKKKSEVPKAIRYLERYLWLVLFNVWVCTTLDTSSSQFNGLKQSFVSWASDICSEIDFYTMMDGLTLD